MSFALGYIRVVDELSRRIGIVAIYLVLICALVSAFNAVFRYSTGSMLWVDRTLGVQVFAGVLNLYSNNSNTLSEAQWYMFAGMVMLGGAWTLKMNEHVRVDIVYSHLSERMRLIVDAVGLLVFLVPAMAFFAWLSWPVFARAFVSGEMSSNYGGLPQWPILLMLPVGFALLALQGLSEFIKRLAALRHEAHVDTHYEKPLQ